MPAVKPIPYYINDFLEYCEIEKGLSPITVRNYARFLERFFEWLKKNKLEKIKPPQLNEDHIRKYRLWLSRRPNSNNPMLPGISFSTQTRYLIALRAYLLFFDEMGIPAISPQKVKLPKEHRQKTIKFLTIEQLEKLFSIPNIKTYTGLRDRAILEVLFSTGLRVAELVSLNRKQFSDIEKRKDFELSIIGKGGHPRIVYFSPRALYWLKRYLSMRDDDSKALFVRLKGPTSAPRRLSARSVELMVQRCAIRAGLPVAVTPHTLRHSFATDLLSQGVDLRVVQEFLGHKNISTTQVYTHITNKRLREIHRKFHSGRMIDFTSTESINNDKDSDAPAADKGDKIILQRKPNL